MNGGRRFAVDCRTVSVLAAVKGVAPDGATEMIVLVVADEAGEIEYLAVSVPDARRLRVLLDAAVRARRPGGG